MISRPGDESILGRVVTISTALPPSSAGREAQYIRHRRNSIELSKTNGSSRRSVMACLETLRFGRAAWHFGTQRGLSGSPRLKLHDLTGWQCLRSAAGGVRRFKCRLPRRPAYSFSARGSAASVSISPGSDLVASREGCRCWRALTTRLLPKLNTSTKGG